MSTVEITVTPSKTTRYLSDTQRQAIIAEVAAGSTQVDVAKRFNVHPNTINTIIRSVRSSVKPGTFPQTSDWRTSQTTLAIQSVNAGLECTDDPYRRMDGGIKVLTGLGVYKSESTSSTTNIYLNVQDLPSDWHSRMEFISGEPPAALDVASRVIDDTETQHD